VPAVPPPTEEERRLASSDLEDCEDVWFAEISDYILETQKRRKVLQGVFDRTISVCYFYCLMTSTSRPNQCNYRTAMLL
jgi:hypothetical protein